VRPDDHSARPRPLAPNAGEHIRAIVEAAERAGESIIDDAEAQARRLIAGAKADAERGASERLSAISDQIDALLDQAEAIRDAAEGLAASLERARGELDPAPDIGGVPEIGGEESGPRLAPVVQLDQNPAERGDDSGARLLATQMAVSGSSREEIENRLRSQFEVDDTTAILDAILGPED
jgi:vacuolar-type H+-ATPase subunit H